MTGTKGTNGIGQYAAVTAAYWGFTLTDGALRMLVLLHFHRLGFSPLELAFLFLLYEAMGVVTNLIGGWIGARFGLRITLFAGLAVQVAALLALSLTDPAWILALSVAYVMGCQAASGIAKDLTKMSSKSAIRAVVPPHAEGTLFTWVALLTGSKNALKGVGFFLGGLLLELLGFQAALWAMAGGLCVVLLVALLTVRADLGRAKGKVSGRDLFAKSREINWLSAARVFLFASRDIWFVVGVPVFLYSTLGWSFDQVGAFMAAWIIGYGVIQAGAPRLLRKTTTIDHGARAARIWAALLLVTTVGLAWVMVNPPPGFQAGWALVAGLLVFGAVFAMNSAVHSWLIVAYSDADKVALNVGFYYMANAWGRLAGTLLSGLVYQWGGLTGTLWGSAALVGLALVLTLPLASPQRKVEAST
ncbi:MAG: organoarsenical effux MFS transporter ArsJ [Rhodospirillum sp.]|nr:organoarsenical effux MFS transporter ArsJ [Rhodospirillum sp.]MCF8489695.1 organoarsenical effux MFS transporter ArsJ [Rhodospirillum sp.]MCF8501670.1 organoarsenical effux MFS transporter ArsJ [Rhodospirillum sp.]